MMTAYERLTLAVEQMQTRGRCIGSLRPRTNLHGGVCLVGGLFRDEELQLNDDGNWFPVAKGAFYWKSVHEALHLMGFTDWPRAFCWNDGISMDPSVVRPTDAEVLARLEAARDRILHQEADKAAVTINDDAEVPVGH